MMNEQLLVLIIQCLLGISLFVSLFLLWRRSGLLAGKKETEVIASQLEGLRQRFSEENELLVTNLQLLTSHKTILSQERKDTILVFFTSLNQWVWDGLNVSIEDYNHTNYQEITAKLARIRDNYNQTNMAFGKLQLVLNDDNLIKNGYEAIMDTLRLHHFVDNTLKTYQKTLSWEKTLLEKITSKDYDFFKLSPDMKTFYERQAVENDAEKRQILGGYNDRHWELFKPVVEKLNDFRDLLKESINELRREIPNGLAEGRWSTLQ